MLNLICVDDDYLFLASLASELKNWGYSPIFSTNPKTALLEMSSAANKSDPIHALITDYHLGREQNALNLCKNVILEFPSTYIVVLTSDSAVQLVDFGNYQPDIILNKFDKYQEFLFYNLQKLERELSVR